MENIITFSNGLILIGAVVISGLTTLYSLKNRNLFSFEKKKEVANEILIQAQKEAEEVLKEVKVNVENRSKNLREDFDRKKERFKKRLELLNEKEQIVQKKENRGKELRLNLVSLEEEVQGVENTIKNYDGKIVKMLSDKSGTTVSDLKNDILNEERIKLETENEEKIVRMEENIKEEAEKTARKIIVNIIQRLCSPTSVETRAVYVSVPKDHIKGKVLGENGENLLELEKHLDVDIVFNELPNTISVSAFRLTQRRIAQKAIESLVRIKGDITPEVVRNTIKKAEEETSQELCVLGDKALKKLNIQNDNKKFSEIVGRLQYRTSYGQNIMKHSMEVAWVSAMLGSEIGLNVQTCKVGGFLHDLGKAIDQDPGIDKPHDLLSKELMEEYGFNWEETHAAWTHHDAIPQETPEAIIVKAADAISASRPGARQESFDKYIERMNALQNIAEEFDGVKKAYPLSAGREVRVFVDAERVDDRKTLEVAKGLAGIIEERLTYPGQIKVNVIRRTKHTETAR